MTRRRAAAPLLVAAYLSVVTWLGVVVALRAPPLTGVDESYHFRRALQLSSGAVLATRLGRNDWGGKLDRRYDEFGAWLDDRRAVSQPVAVVDAIHEAARLQAEPDGRKVDSFPSTASYPPLPYVGSAAGLALARRAHTSLLHGLLVGRLGGLLLYIALVAVIVGVLPYGRAVTLALLTTPASIGLAACFSADPLTNGLSTLFAAAVLRLNVAPKAGPTSKILLLLLAGSLGLLKLSCAMLSGLSVLVPARLFRSRQAARSYRLCLVLLAVGVAVAWNARYPFVPSQYWRSGGDPAAAFAFVRHHPVAWLLRALFNIRELWFGWWAWSYSGFGGGPPPYDFVEPDDIAAFAAVLCGLALISSDRRGAGWRVAAVLAAVATAYVFEILLLFTLGFSPPDSVVIQGVQGRYLLLPIIILALAASALRPSWRSGPAAVPVLGLYLVMSGRSVYALAHAYRHLWT